MNPGLRSDIELQINDHQLKQHLYAQQVMLNIIQSLGLKTREDKKLVREMVLNSKYPFFEIDYRTPYDHDPIISHVIKMERLEDRILKAIRSALELRPHNTEYILMLKHIIDNLKLKYYQDKLTAYNIINKKLNEGILTDSSYGGQNRPLITKLLNGPLREISYEKFMDNLYDWKERIEQKRKDLYFWESKQLIRAYKCLTTVLLHINTNFKFYNKVLLHFLAYKICEYFDVPLEPLENRFSKKRINQVISDLKSRYEECLEP